MRVATGNSQGLQVANVGYPTRATGAALSSPSTQQLLVHSATAYNGSASAQNLGLGVRLSSTAWKLYTLGATTTDVTSTIQASSAVSVLPTTNNYGFYVQAKAPFGLLVFNVSQAQTGSPVYEYTYWNGSTFAALTTIDTISYTATGEMCVAFNPPVDWAQGHNAQLTDFTTGAGYTIRVRATTAPTQAVQINSLGVAKLWAVRQVPGKGQLEIDFTMRPLQLDAYEGIQPYYQTLSTASEITIAYQVSP
jgi:hypothetical protein